MLVLPRILSVLYFILHKQTEKKKQEKKATEAFPLISLQEITNKREALKPVKSPVKKKKRKSDDRLGAWPISLGDLSKVKLRKVKRINPVVKQKMS